MNSPVFLSSPAPFLSQFVQYKRALNRKYRTDAEVLRLFDRYLQSRHIADWSAIDSALIDDFLKSRPRVSPRSYNHLLGIVHRFFAFAVMQEWVQRNPVTASPRPETGTRIPYLFDLNAARRLLAVVRSLPERSRARYRGLVYETIFALLYGLGLRVGEVVRLTLADVDFTRDLLFIQAMRKISKATSQTNRGTFDCRPLETRIGLACSSRCTFIARLLPKKVRQPNGD